MRVTNIKEIIVHNDRQFILDLRKCKSIVSYSVHTNYFFDVRKIDLLNVATQKKIIYTMSREIFVNKRMTMIIV